MKSHTLGRSLLTAASSHPAPAAGHRTWPTAPSVARLEQGVDNEVLTNLGRLRVRRDDHRSLRTPASEQVPHRDDLHLGKRVTGRVVIRSSRLCSPPHTLSGVPQSDEDPTRCPRVVSHDALKIANRRRVELLATLDGHDDLARPFLLAAVEAEDAVLAMIADLLVVRCAPDQRDRPALEVKGVSLEQVMRRRQVCWDAKDSVRLVDRWSVRLPQPVPDQVDRDVRDVD